MTQLTKKHTHRNHGSLIANMWQIVAIIVWPNLSIAVPDIDRSSEFVVGGMHFFCSGCETKGDGPAGEPLCEVELKGERSLETCSHATELLLNAAVDDSDFSGPPSIVELRSALLRPAAEISPVSAQLILQLLIRTTEGQQALTEALNEISAKRAAELVASFRFWKDSPRLTKAFWALSPLASNPALMQLRLLAASANKELGIDAIVAELGTEQSTLEVAKLNSWAELLKSFAAEGKAANGAGEPVIIGAPGRTGLQLAELSAAIERCLQGFVASAQPILCPPSTITDPQLVKHLEKYRLKLLLEQSEHLSAEQFLLMLAQADLANHRTPETLLAARRALSQLGLEEALIPPELFEGTAREMLMILAQSDVDLAAAVAKVMVNAASTQFNLGEFDRGVALIQESLRIYPSTLEIRRSLLEAMLRTSAVQADARWRSVITELSARSGSKPRRIWPWLLGVLIAGVVVAFFRKLRNSKGGANDTTTAGAPNDEGLNPIERAELRTLLSYFGLPGYATEDELTAEYRQKAKVMHPDSETGEHEEFVQLRERFERAKALIARR